PTRRWPSDQAATRWTQLRDGRSAFAAILANQTLSTHRQSPPPAATPDWGDHARCSNWQTSTIESVHPAFDGAPAAADHRAQTSALHNQTRGPASSATNRRSVRPTDADEPERKRSDRPDQTATRPPPVAAGTAAKS